MKLKEALSILGFEDVTVLPKLKGIQKHFHRLCKTKHPDKNNGSKESTAEFQTLLEAYKTAGKAAEKVLPENEDLEDIVARKVFHQFQFSSVKVNSQSVTIKTEKALNSVWLEVLTSNLGEPTVSKEVHGKKFVMADKCEEPPTNVYLTLYTTGNLLVQAQGNKQSINIHFINDHLKDLFMQVYNRAKLLDKPSGKQAHKTPLRKLTKTNKNPLKKVKCPKCDYATNITSHLVKHTKQVHGGTLVRKLSISCEEDCSNTTDVIIQSISSSAPTVKCLLCGSIFDSKSEMNSHIEMVHELNCSVCTKAFYDKYDLDIHMITHNTQAEYCELKCTFCEQSFYTDSDYRLHVAANHTRTNLKVQENYPKTLLQELKDVGEVPLLQNHPEINKETFQDCAYCKVVFSDDEDLEKHIKEHEQLSSTSQLNCDKCKFTTAEEVVLKHHTLMMHVPGFECHECGKIIFPDDHVIGCSNCEYFFHKQCIHHDEQGFEPTLAWLCHFCSQSTCYLCKFEAGNNASLVTHMLSNHCPDVAAQCYFCDKRFSHSDTLHIHIQNHHAPEYTTLEENSDENMINFDDQQLSSPYTKTIDDKYDKRVGIAEDPDEHIGENMRVDALNKCKDCDVAIKSTELFICCDHCSFNYHKKCTNLKKAGGHWKPSHWNCSLCKDTSNSVTPPSDTASKQSAYNPTQSRPSGKHRKSNAIGCDHPDIEFLESQINTLKSIVAKREAELKKIQESDNLKAKKIMNLESQLAEARKLACQTKTITDTQTVSNNLFESSKIDSLETKTNNLENQIKLLSTKIDSIDAYKRVNCPENIPEVNIIYSCNFCESEFETKMNLNDHIQKTHAGHQSLKCDICNFTTSQESSIKAHMETHSHRQYIHCKLCEFQANTEDDLRTHMYYHHWKCQDCSYHAIHMKDLRRHRNTMHTLPKNCLSCSYVAQNDFDLKRHQFSTHNQDNNECQYQTKSQEYLPNHIGNPHVNRQRTRIFSARRSSSSTIQPTQVLTPQTKEVFRPWSSSNASSTTSLPSSYLPRPFKSTITDIPDGFLKSQNYNQD